MSTSKPHTYTHPWERLRAVLNSHSCQCVKADYSPSNTICCLIYLNLPVLIQGFNLRTTSELQEIMWQVAPGWYWSSAYAEDTRRLNKRLELQQKRNRHALTKSLTVDSSGDAGESLEDDRAVRVCSWSRDTMFISALPSHTAFREDILCWIMMLIWFRGLLFNCRSSG